MKRIIAMLLAALVLVGCEQGPAVAVGQLESDRVEIVAESNEPIVGIAVREGDRVEPGQELLRQDTSRIDLKIAQAQASVAELEARLNELRNGPRVETIAAAEARLREATVNRDFYERELQRLSSLLDRELTSREAVDKMANQYEGAAARLEAVTAELAELQAGTRSEQLLQAERRLEQARQQRASLELDRDRHILSAPVAGRVDSLPFEVGERPLSGRPVAILLTGSQPHARVYIPESKRLQVAVGNELPVHIDGRSEPLLGTVRRIASEASFTPYFALTERDRSRLAYVAEITLPTTPTRLPEGVPVQVYLE